MMVWTCPECHYKNEVEDEKVDDFWCENCGKPVEDIMRAGWVQGPEDALTRGDLC